MQPIPWELSRVPNYSRSIDVETRDPHTCTPADFEEIVKVHRPVRFPGAIHHWEASLRWKDLNYFRHVIDPETVITVAREPNVESHGIRSREGERRADAARALLRRDNRPFRELIELLAPEGESFVAASLYSNHGAFGALENDFGELPFVQPTRLDDSLIYPKWAVILYRNAFSDWHFHPFTEAIMFQVAGVKEVLLLPSDATTYARVQPVHEYALKVWDVDLDRFPDFAGIQPYRTMMHPGDGLFIPYNWWHTVQSRDSQFGVTAPIWWPALRSLHQDPKH